MLGLLLNPSLQATSHCPTMYFLYNGFHSNHEPHHNPGECAGSVICTGPLSDRIWWAQSGQKHYNSCVAWRFNKSSQICWNKVTENCFFRHTLHNFSLSSLYFFFLIFRYSWNYRSPFLKLLLFLTLSVDQPWLCAIPALFHYIQNPRIGLYIPKSSLPRFF